VKKFCLFISLFCLIVACKSDNNYADALEVASEFLNYYENFDFENAQKLACEENKKMLEIEDLLTDEPTRNLREGNPVKITIKDNSLEYDSTKQTITATYLVDGHINRNILTGDSAFVCQETKEIKLQINKIDNKWRVNFTN
jgi:hypothetical protein